jgi:Domain of unknown function (DUF4926)
VFDGCATLRAIHRCGRSPAIRPGKIWYGIVVLKMPALIGTGADPLPADATVPGSRHNAIVQLSRDSCGALERLFVTLLGGADCRGGLATSTGHPGTGGTGTVKVMAIDDLPLPVVNLLNVVGVPWPYIDEDMVSRFATFVREFGRAVQTTHDDATRGVAGIAAAYRGSATDTMMSGWGRMSATHVPEGGKVNLYDMVRLMVDLPDEDLSAGAVGAIVHVFEKPNLAYKVEFADEDGRTIAQLPLTPGQIQKVDA